MTALLTAARTRHRSLTTDTCVIDRATEPVFDPDTGDYTTVSLTLYSGVCRVKGPTAGNAAINEPRAGEAQQQTTRQALVLPYGQALGVANGDRVTVNGRLTFTVVGQVQATTMTARSILIEAVDDPHDVALLVDTDLGGVAALTAAAS